MHLFILILVDLLRNQRERSYEQGTFYSWINWHRGAHRCGRCNWYNKNR